MKCDKYDKCTKTDCGMCDEMTQDLINKINVNVGLAQPIKLDEKYSDLIVFDDQPKRQLKSPEIHND